MKTEDHIAMSLDREEKKKMLFLANWDISQSDGISKKINAQISALRKKYDVCELVIPLLRSHGPISQWLRTIIAFLRLERNFIVYERNVTGITGMVVKCMLLIKRFETVYLEIPTYPSENHLKFRNSKFKRTFREIVYKYIYKKILYMGYSSNEKIYGLQSVSIENGIDLERLKIRDDKRTSGFVMVGASSLANWHGYDRVISGLVDYKHKDVYFEVAGSGPELVRLMRLAHDLGVHNQVIFHGELSGPQLDVMFDRCDVCIDSLGRHRSGHAINLSLKAREYCARGIPFVKSHSDPVFDKCDFVLTVKDDDSPINIEEIRIWRGGVRANSTSIREFAIDHFRWEKIYQRAGLL